ncbi:Uncharacterized protein MSYG_1702 [Malassezia sympodialis ATCC 42132]|uniref:Uncharacterized protein n=1 Tax=Malassezia sympodialis (strain ATCC 42132) TaxID=1230383 RepID=A0A1M8A4L7_MALS4|nr:Uncharacterized protein MSYG_1702 [Malassezia sympodialis ATCC 42132]
MPEVEWHPPVRVIPQEPVKSELEEVPVAQAPKASDTPGPSQGAGPDTQAERPQTNHEDSALATSSAPGPYSYAEQDTAKWNSLLLWAREQRGPQWDASTGLWQVPHGTALYYGFQAPNEGTAPR